MLDRDQEPSKEVRNYVKERYASAIQLMKNIEQRKQTILKVCQSIVRRQLDFLEYGIDQLKPMMIKEVAEEIGVHPSTVSRAVASKYAHTPQGVFELRYFFSEAVQGICGQRHSAADPEAQGEEDDRGGGYPAPADGRADHRSTEGGGNRRDPANGGEIPGRHEDSIHPSAPGSQLELPSYGGQS